MREVKIGRYLVTLTNEDKELFPKAHITKGDLIDYYERIAPVMLPHIKNRPLTMHRFPQGIKEEGFYQKDAGKYFPSWIKRVAVAKKDNGTVHYVVCNNAATLVYLANQACITPHIWLSKMPKLNYPDRMIFDLDPSGKATFALVQWTARIIRDFLEEELGLTTFVMTTGSRGVHVVVPLKQKHTFDKVRECAYGIAELLVNRYSKKLTLEMRKIKRGNKIFLDTLRNSYGATGVAPYAVRAKPGAPIATPIEWDELFKKGVTPQKYTIKNLFQRLSRKKDPWKDINKSACSLNKAFRNLQKILKSEAEE